MVYTPFGNSCLHAILTCCPNWLNQQAKQNESVAVPNPCVKFILEKLDASVFKVIEHELRAVLETYLDFPLIELSQDVKDALDFCKRCVTSHGSEIDSAILFKVTREFLPLLRNWRIDRDLLSIQQAFSEAIGCRPPIMAPDPTSFIQWVADNTLKLQNVVTLDLSNRRICALPLEIGQLTALQVLNLANNRLHRLPDELRNCSRLTHLNLSTNQFSALPHVVADLSTLVSLELRNNYLVNIATEISRLSALQCLDVSNNKVTQLPSEISFLRSLRRLDITKNPLSGSLPPLVSTCAVEITQDGTSSLSRRLSARLRL